jgi:hypothetical protein
LTFRNYLLAIHPLNELTSSNSLMPKILSLNACILIELLSFG